MSLDRFATSCSLGTFVIRLAEIMNHEDLFLRFGTSGSYFKIDQVESGEMGIHLRLHGLGPYFIPVEMIECDSFIRFEGQPRAIIPGWMTA